MSMPSSSELVATTQRRMPLFSSSSTCARCSFDTDPWCAFASTGGAPADTPACAIISAGIDLAPEPVEAAPEPVEVAPELVEGRNPTRSS